MRSVLLILSLLCSLQVYADDVATMDSVDPERFHEDPSSAIVPKDKQHFSNNLAKPIPPSDLGALSKFLRASNNGQPPKSGSDDTATEAGF